jgi:hypothetical protein
MQIQNIGKTSIMNPQWFQCGSGSSILGQCKSGFSSGSGSGSRVLMTKICKNFQLKILLFFYQKFQLIYPSMTDVQDTGEASVPQKSTGTLHRALQNMKVLKFFYSIFVGRFHILDPDPADQKQCGSMRIRIHIKTSWIRNTAFLH